MKATRILLVAMPSIHFFRWVSHIDSERYKLYWYNILNMDYDNEYNQYFEKIYHTDKRRKVRYIKGEYFLNKNVPSLFKFLRPYLEITENEIVKNIIEEIRPEIFHSFEMQSCTYPIINCLIKKSKVKWIYSCWGSDLYYYQNYKVHRKLIKSALNRINYIHTDNLRDQKIARSLGFKGTFTEIIPGGGGYDITTFSNYFKPLNQRKYILVKGYEHTMGRAINIIKALALLREDGYHFEVVFFGAHPKVIGHLKLSNFDATYYKVKELKYTQVLKMMGNSFIYIGNSISDGLPNTLIEAFLMGTFPIQSNPGGATAELVEHQVNGSLIYDPENVDEIRSGIKWVLENRQQLEKQVINNHIFARKEYSFEKIQSKINNLYSNIFDQLN